MSASSQVLYLGLYSVELLEYSKERIRALSDTKNTISPSTHNRRIPNQSLKVLKFVGLFGGCIEEIVAMSAMELRNLFGSTRHTFPWTTSLLSRKCMSNYQMSFAMAQRPLSITQAGVFVTSRTVYEGS